MKKVAGPFHDIPAEIRTPQSSREQGVSAEQILFGNEEAQRARRMPGSRDDTNRRPADPQNLPILHYRIIGTGLGGQGATSAHMISMYMRVQDVADAQSSLSEKTFIHIDRS